MSLQEMLNGHEAVFGKKVSWCYELTLAKCSKFSKT